MPKASSPLVLWPADKPLPSLMTGAELMQVLGMRRANFWRKQKLGVYRHLEVQRPDGPRRYSGYLVDKFRKGESTVRFGAQARRAS